MSERTAGKRLLRGVLNAACFALGFAAFGAVVNWREPIPPHVEQVSDKLELYARSGADYDCVFFGSSKINNGFIPAVFDEENQRRGRRLSSFNFGIGGMGFPESGYVCRHVLERFRRKPKYVFVEAAAVRWYIPYRYLHTRRVQYWHDFRGTFLTVRALLTDNPSWRALAQNRDEASSLSAARVLREHLLMFALRHSRMGEGAERLGEALAPAESKPAPADPALRGYAPLHTTISGRALLAYEQNVRSFDPNSVRPGEPFWDDAYRDLQQAVERAGAKLILVVFPNHIPSRPLFEGAPAGAPPVWWYEGPAQFPELYKPAHRESNVHLNDRGAHLFTSMLAERFDAWLKESAPSTTR